MVAAAVTVIFGGVKFYTRLKDLPESHEKLAKRVGRMAIGLTRVEKDFEFLKKDMDAMRTEFTVMKSDIDQRFDRMESRFDKKLDTLENKFDKRSDMIEQKIDKLCRCRNYKAAS